MKQYFGGIFNTVNDNSVFLKKMHSVEIRYKEIELIMTISSQGYNEVYAFYDRFVNKSTFNSQNDVLYFLVDATGALRADTKIDYKCLLFQLVILKLKDNTFFMGLFSQESIAQSDKYYTVFTNFISQYLLTWNLVRYERQIYYLLQLIANLITDKIDLLQDLYTLENA